MIADPSGTISMAYGTYVKEKGISFKATFIIDPEGIIREYEMSNELLGRNVKEIIRKINALKFSRNRKQEFCPVEIMPEEKINIKLIKSRGK